jgi:hypothetical protein
VAEGDETGDVFRQARPAVAGAGTQETGPDTVVAANAGKYRAGVRAKRFSQVGHLVGERDLDGQERIRGVLDQFGTAAVAPDDG